MVKLCFVLRYFTENRIINEENFSENPQRAWKGDLPGMGLRRATLGGKVGTIELLKHFQVIERRGTWKLLSSMKKEFGKIT